MKTDKLNVKVGQTVWVKPSSNHRTEQERAIRETSVTKVGRKYFEVEGEIYTKFNLSDGVQKDWSNYKRKVYVSKQDLSDEQEHSILSKEIKSLFSTYSSKLNYSLETLRKIKFLLDNDKN